MRTKITGLLQATAIFALGVAGATHLNTAANPEQTATQPAQAMHHSVVNNSTADGSVHSITLPYDEPLFPPGSGREEFVTACVVCHSPRYITMQPKFSASTWLSEVKKMKDVYGAHISDEQVRKITDYLVHINGKPDTGNALKGTYGE